VHYTYTRNRNTVTQTNTTNFLKKKHFIELTLSAHCTQHINSYQPNTFNMVDYFCTSLQMAEVKLMTKCSSLSPRFTKT